MPYLNLTRRPGKNIPGLICLLLSGLLTGCNHRQTASAAIPHYFSLASYFQAEEGRMQASQPKLMKMINVDGKKETRTLSKAVWPIELQFFESADINKPAWLGKYRVDSNSAGLRYRALDSSLKVREISIGKSSSKAGSKVSFVKVHIAVQNFLYSLDEQLIYLPDSLYSINRTQHINLLGKKVYQITGRIISQ